jgi:hypothetical protein
MKRLVIRHTGPESGRLVCLSALDADLIERACVGETGDVLILGFLDHCSRAAPVSYAICPGLFIACDVLGQAHGGIGTPVTRARAFTSACKRS